MVNPVARLVRANLAAVLAFIEEWQPATTPRRTMQDAVDELNAYESEYETLPESEPVTVSAGEKFYQYPSPSPIESCVGGMNLMRDMLTQSSPFPHGDVSRPVAASAETSDGAVSVPPTPAPSHPNFNQDDVKRICGWVRAAVRTDKADDALLRGFLRLIDVSQQK